MVMTAPYSDINVYALKSTTNLVNKLSICFNRNVIPQRSWLVEHGSAVRGRGFDYNFRDNVSTASKSRYDNNNVFKVSTAQYIFDD